MSKTLHASVVRLKKSTVRLNKTADDATRVVLGVEAFLSRQCTIGVAACILVSHKLTELEGSMQSTSLCYESYQGKYRIAVMIGNADQPSSSQAWSDSDRIVQLETVKMLPDLLVRISEVVDARISAAEDATASVSEVLRSVTEVGSGRPTDAPPRPASNPAGGARPASRTVSQGPPDSATPAPERLQSLGVHWIVRTLRRFAGFERRGRSRREIAKQRGTMIRYSH